jgi:hypothetical protein
VIQRASARRIISTYHLSIEWHLLMDSTRHTLTTDVTEVLSHILCDDYFCVKLANEDNVKEPVARQCGVPYTDNPANETDVHRGIVEMKS